MSTVRYQTMPPLSTEEYAELEQSILSNGIQVPILVDEHGVVIDGHHRKAIAEQHGLYLPSETRAMLTEAQKTELSIQLNIARRQLSKEQIAAQIARLREAGKSIRAIADLTSMPKSTVSDTLRELSESGQLEQPESVMGTDGKERPASRAVQVESMRVDARTGEVLDTPEQDLAPVEVTHTETARTVEKFDQPSMKSREVKPVPRGDEANLANAIQASKAIGSALETLLGLTYPKYREGILTDWWPLGKNEVPPSQTELFSPSQLRHIAQGIIQTANEMEALRVH